MYMIFSKSTNFICHISRLVSIQYGVIMRMERRTGRFVDVPNLEDHI